MPEDFNSETNQGLSDHSRKLAADTKELLEKYFPAPEEGGGELTERELAYNEINKGFVRTCLVSLFSEMSPDERRAFNGQPIDIAHLIRMAADKLNFSKDDKELVESEIKKITPEGARSPVKLLTELNLLNHESPLYKLKKTIYDSLQDSSEAAEALSYLSLTS